MEWIKEPEITTNSEFDQDNPENRIACGPILGGGVACLLGPLCGRLCIIHSS